MLKIVEKECDGACLRFLKVFMLTTLHFSILSPESVKCFLNFFSYVWTTAWIKLGRHVRVASSPNPSGGFS